MRFKSWVGIIIGMGIVSLVVFGLCWWSFHSTVPVAKARQMVSAPAGKSSVNASSTAIKQDRIRARSSVWNRLGSVVKVRENK